MNHQEVAEEDRRKKLPANWEAMQRRVEWENKEEEVRKVEELCWKSLMTYHKHLAVFMDHLWVGHIDRVI